MVVEPKAGARTSKATQTRMKRDLARFVGDLVEQYREDRGIRIVLDNLNTHFAKSFYETFSKTEAEKITFYYSLVPGS